MVPNWNCTPHSSDVLYSSTVQLKLLCKLFICSFEWLSWLLHFYIAVLTFNLLLIFGTFMYITLVPLINNPYRQKIRSLSSSLNALYTYLWNCSFTDVLIKPCCLRTDFICFHNFSILWTKELSLWHSLSCSLLVFLLECKIVIKSEVIKKKTLKSHIVQLLCFKPISSKIMEKTEHYFSWYIIFSSVCVKSL